MLFSPETEQDSCLYEADFLLFSKTYPLNRKSLCVLAGDMSASFSPLNGLVIGWSEIGSLDRFP
jgi:hypothetical protein